MPDTPNQQFYVVGGTVNPDSPSYVVRQADQELFDRVTAGNFCYVLTSRQMGKSSLMARAAKRLSEAGVRTAIVDLTQIGTEKEKQSADQWYYGIAHRILRELQIRDVNLGEWNRSRQNLPALQRLMEFFSDVVLEKASGKIVIFIDEIDSTISLPFTDDFFAAIRACYNARATDPAYNRLSFVLLGVASPSDLVKDSTRTPFNIGQRIELTDFTFEEAKPLAAGLSVNGHDGEEFLRRVLDWTSGHPYLTQKLCGAMQRRDGQVTDDADRVVDSLVEQSLLSQTASREDSNLNFVRDWLKGNKKLGLKVFKLYRRIRQGKPVADAPLSPVQNHLKLSGVVSLRPEHTLRVRNRVYERVFTSEWAKKAMPVDWNRRVAVTSTALLLLSVGLWYTAWKPLENVTPLQTAIDDYPGRYHEALRRYPWYAGYADELLAQFWDRRALRDEGWGRDEALLERLQALAAKPSELRRKEAALLIGSDYRNLDITFRHGDDVYAVAYSPDGKRVLTGSDDGTARQWDAQTGQPIGEPLRHASPVSAVAYSSDGKRVLTGSEDGTARQWDAQTGQWIGEPLRPGGSVSAVAYNSDGKRVLTVSGDGTARQWDAQTGRPIGEPL
ncbi:MAG TPA: AAA-like domain-containing protein, partial [Blastocatellia bacterium]|nr:AAA-like domain-containing protein [Blastocatellia bacterium]